MLKNNAAYKIAKRAEKATGEEANKKSNKKVIKKMPTNAEEITLKKKGQKACKQRSRSTTKSQLMKKSTKTAHAKAIKYINELEKQNRQAVTQPNASLNDNTRQQLVHANGAFHFDDDSIDHIEPFNQRYCFTTIFRQKKQRRIRKDVWAEESVSLKKWYLESHEIHGHADPTLKVPNQLKSTYQCNCNNKKTLEVYCYMLHNYQKIKVDYCMYQPILKKLVLMQMRPSSTIQPKAAVHFVVFEELMSLKLNGSICEDAEC